MLTFRLANNLYLTASVPRERHGPPTQNAFIESFNGKFRDECLNQNWVVGLRHAREVIEAWRVGYSTKRPHSTLGTTTRFRGPWM